MKKSIFLLIAMFGILSSQAFAALSDEDPTKTAAGSVDQESCIDGTCSAPVYQKVATLLSQQETVERVKAVMGDGEAKPDSKPNSLQNEDSKAHK